MNMSSVAVSFEGMLKNADPHARQAFVGTYGVGKGGDGLSLEGGSCVLWQYAQAARASKGRR